MIKNERQYRITKTAVERFRHALADLESGSSQSDLHPLLKKAEQDAVRSQLEDLVTELEEYESLQSGKHQVLEVNALEELPDAFIRARIAAGLSQKDLAERLGVKQQQIQHYEATAYAGASMIRLQEVCRALEVNIHEDVFLSTPAHSPETLFPRLAEIGLEKNFIMTRFIPRAISENAKTDPDAESGRIKFHALTTASHIYGWTPAAILGDSKLWLDKGVLGAARFKVNTQAEEKKLSAYTIYAHFLALQLLEATADLPVQPIPTDAKEVRRQVIAAYGEVTLETVLQYVWDLGVPVLPLNDPGAFHGAHWRVNGRNVIVLKQRTRSTARWLHDLLHELRHAGDEANLRERTVIEAAETSPERLESDEEIEATQFAADVVLDGRAEELAKLCVQATKKQKGPGSLQLLKSVVPKIAATAGVPTDALANYMAFRLSLQGEDWWGTAMNLQSKNGKPWLIARDVVLHRARLGRLIGRDRDLLTLALTDTEE